MAVDGPAPPCAPSASQEVLDTDRRRSSRRRARHRSCRCTASSSCATSASTTPGPRRPCSTTSTFAPHAGQTHGDHRQHRLGQDHAAQPGPAAVRRHLRRASSSTASTCATSTPSSLWTPHRPGAAEAVPVLRHRRQQPALRQARTPPTRSCGRRSRSPRRRDFVRGHARRARRPDRPGRHQRVGRPAPAARHRPGAGPQAGDLPVRRLVLGARPRHRRAAARAGADGHARRRRASIVAQRVSHHRERRPDPRARGRPIVGLGTHRELLETCPTYAEIVASQLTRGGGGVSDRPNARRQPNGTSDGQTARRQCARRRREARRAPVAAGSPHGVGVPAEKSQGTSSASSRRLLRRLAPQRRRRRRRPRASPSSASRSTVHRARSILGHATDIIFDGIQQRARHRLRDAAPHAAARASCCYLRRRPRLAYTQACLLAGVVQRTMFRLRADVEDKLNRLPLRLRRPPAPRRPAQPRSPTTSTTSRRACSRRSARCSRRSLTIVGVRDR